jgi:hypothetical protein
MIIVVFVMAELVIIFSNHNQPQPVKLVQIFYFCSYSREHGLNDDDVVYLHDDPILR